MGRGRALWWTKARARFRRDRDPVTPLEARARARELFNSWLENQDDETLEVLADALLESDVPELGEDLAYALQDRDVRPGARRGEPILATYRGPNLWTVRRRISEELSWSTRASRDDFEARARQESVSGLRAIDRDWSRLSRAVRSRIVTGIAGWLETPGGVVTLQDRTESLFDGTFGRGPQVIAREIASTSRQNRERQLFQLVLALDDNIANAGADQTWRALSRLAQANVNRAMRNALHTYGAVVDDHRPAQRRRRDGRHDEGR